MAGVSDEVAWFDKDLDDFDITVDKVFNEEDILENESGTYPTYL